MCVCVRMCVCVCVCMCAYFMYVCMYVCIISVYFLILCVCVYVLTQNHRHIRLIFKWSSFEFRTFLPQNCFSNQGKTSNLHNYFLAAGEDRNGWLFEFHGTSTTMGYSMPNPVYIYELYMICNHFFIWTHVFFMNSLFFYTHVLIHSTHK